MMQEMRELGKQMGKIIKIIEEVFMTVGVQGLDRVEDQRSE